MTATDTKPSDFADYGLVAPAALQVEDAYDELTAHHVDAVTAREWLADLVNTVGMRRIQAEIEAPKCDQPGPLQADDFEPTRQEWIKIHRMLTVALAILNGRRPRLRDIFDQHLATTTGRTSINTAADLVAAAGPGAAITIRRHQAQAIREPKQTTFYIPAIITWGPRYRALATTINRDRHGTYRFSAFTIL